MISIVNSDCFPMQNKQIAFSKWNENVVSVRYEIFIHKHT